jgi:hypothetical protein
VGRTQIVCNPHGYGSENPTFDGALVVEIGDGDNDASENMA